MNTMIKRPFINFAAVKAAVSLTQILEHYGLAVRMCCPIHGGTNPNEFSVNTERSIWKCFSKCGRGGNISTTCRWWKTWTSTAPRSSSTNGSH